jgi:Tol biopolymer transport system component
VATPLARPARLGGALLVLAFGTSGHPGGAQVPEPEPPTGSPEAGERLAASVVLRVPDAARPAWSRQGDWIAYDRRGPDGFNDLYVAKPDNAFDRCLTCELPELANRHAGNADWHPSGSYLVFQSERPFKHDGEPYAFLAVPGRNLDSAVWVVSVEGRSLWQLTGHQQTPYPSHSPRFSFEGDRLAWSERVASAGTWGDWVLRVGEFSAPRGVARVRDVRTFEPAAQHAFYEVSSFTPDDNGLLFAGNLIEGQPIDGLDLYTNRLEGDEVRQLTKDLTHWDRFPALAPSGAVVAWSSSQGLRRPPRPLSRDDRLAVVPMDLWIGALDGSWARRLTGFNDALSEEYSGPVMVGPSVWAPQGDRLLTTVTPIADPEHSDLFLVVLGESFGPQSPLLR